MSRYKLPDLTPAFAADEIVSTITNFLIITDENRKIQYINPVGLKLLGYSEGEFEGKNIEMFIPHALNSKILAEECLNNFETILKDKQGKNIPVLLSKSMISKKSTLMGILYMVQISGKEKLLKWKKGPLQSEQLPSRMFCLNFTGRIFLILEKP